MARHFCTDVGKLEAYTISSGGIRVKARLGRTGVQEYRRADGSVVRAYRPPEEVFRAGALDSARGVPITVGHPARVRPKNWRELSIGTVLDARKAEQAVDGEEWIDGEIVINAEDAIPKVGTDLQECSLAYDYDLDPTPGITAKGEKYDFVQRNIVYNALGVGPFGFARAGRPARLGLDGNEELVEEMSNMPAEKRMISYDGITTEFGSETHISLLEKSVKTATDGLAAADAKCKDLEGRLGAADARADKAEKCAKDLEGKLAAVDGTIETRVNEALAFRAKLAPVLGDGYDFKGKSNKNVLLDVVAKLNPNKKFEADAAEATIQAYADAMLDARTDYNRNGSPPELGAADGGDNPYAACVAKAGKRP